ncbi:MAG: aminoacetone oxidase family FAD-binding enzyme [Stappia sp.]|uniref:NAD(P)/FAD-dependent oxidoreductase n=1 Tax=Stappia sp. TaxID=1870903 RepID=UPI000C392E63|nr:NAD(P)/FAD-dependent oxidoreductase [Stappia sp.]MAA96775.1 aminoacetone oxidase family FAD-binding enzyme [Stappia sp.]MBM21894.1 aminoacetone oxidase family FAD-binding enzyme [Stappia sp.]
MQQYDVLIIGAGAAGLMCAAVAGARGRKVLLIDHARAPGEKIRISGGGRCNFTNIHASPKNFLSANRHFHKSALARYTPADFLALVERHGIAWHEKTLGQLFCDDTARQIVIMLLEECRAGGVELRLSTSASAIERRETGFSVRVGEGTVEVSSLVIATGGKSIPKMGATGFAYEVAERFGLPLVEQRAGLVPFTLDPATLEMLAPLAGIAVPAEICCGRTCFREALLFTHRGLSGPAVLQISSYWRPGDEIRIRLLPEVALAERLVEAKREAPRQSAANLLAAFLPKKLAQLLVEQAGLGGGAAGDLSDKALRALAERAQDWRLKPSGTEGYRTAEVTLGGVDTSALSSQTMEARDVPGLYFIGECVDVTGWLGGYNFQWAWASAQAAGQAV